MYASDLKHENQTLGQKLHQLLKLNRSAAIMLGFRPQYLSLLESLGNPHKSLPPTIHVAGTNGKGSTIAFLRAILEAAGYSVHSYTSPHLIRFNERINLNGKPINDGYLESLIDEVIEKNQGNDVTFFEITTALAFKAFAENPSDFLLLEVGLGGRLDCTNIIEDPILSIINTVSLDHTDFLGETLPKIAAEKAGIMKHNVPCVIGVQDPQIWPIFEKQGESTDSPLFRNGSDWFITGHPCGLCFESGSESHLYKTPALTGLHQKQNAGLAIAAAKKLSIMSHARLTDDHINHGLKNVHWPGRLQKLESPDENWQIWLDGGHNEDAGRALANQIEEWAHQEGNTDVHLIVAMMAHKNPKGFLTPLLKHIKSLSVIDIPNEPQSFKAADITASLTALNPDLQLTQSPNWRKAVEQIIANNQGTGHILIAGSLYLAGHILQDLQNQAHNTTK